MEKWDKEPPPGFAPDGSSLILPPGQKPQYPDQKIIGPDGKEYTQAEYTALENAADWQDGEDDDDLSDLDDLDEIAKL